MPTAPIYSSAYCLGPNTARPVWASPLLVIAWNSLLQISITLNLSLHSSFSLFSTLRIFESPFHQSFPISSVFLSFLSFCYRSFSNSGICDFSEFYYRFAFQSKISSTFRYLRPFLSCPCVSFPCNELSHIGPPLAQEGFAILIAVI